MENNFRLSIATQENLKGYSDDGFESLPKDSFLKDAITLKRMINIAVPAIADKI